MKAALLIGGLGVVLVVLTPALRALRPGSRISDAEYFAAARKRAISYRLAKPESAAHELHASGGD